MKKILTIIGILLLISLVSAIPARDIIPIQTQVTSGGAIITGTFTFTYNFSTSSSCTPVLYSNITTASTDPQGIVNFNLAGVEILNFSEQTFVCVYIDSVLDEVIELAKGPNTFSWINLDNFNSTQMENSNGFLNILESWFESKWDAIFGTKTTDNLNEGTTNLYDNQTWNESRGNTLYAPNTTEGISVLINNTNINILDLNASSATIHGDLNVTGTSYLGNFVLDGNLAIGSGNYSGFNLTLDGNASMEKLFVNHIGERDSGHNVIFDNNVDLGAFDLTASIVSAIALTTGVWRSATDSSDTELVLLADKLKPNTGHTISFGDVINPFVDLHLSGDANVGGNITAHNGTYLGDLFGNSLTLNTSFDPALILNSIGDVGNSGSTQGQGYSFTGGEGWTNTATSGSNQGGFGGDFFYDGGDGGDAQTDDFVALGGKGGSSIFFLGNGGDASGTGGFLGSTGGIGGIFNITGRKGGDATNTVDINVGGVGGEFIFTGGDGGDTSGGSSNTGGVGGGVDFIAGDGGTGATSNGDGGSVLFQSGTGATDGNIRFRVGGTTIFELLADGRGGWFGSKKMLLGSTFQGEIFHSGTGLVLDDVGGTNLINFTDDNLLTTGNLNVSNATFSQLINLDVSTLPTCGASVNGSIGRNESGTFGCNSSSVWVRIF